MAKTRTTLTIDEDVLKSTRVAAAHRGMKEGELIEEALRRHLGLGVFERIWNEADNADLSDMSEDELMDWVVAIQHETRRLHQR